MSQVAKEYATAFFESLKTSEDKVNALSFLRVVIEALKIQPEFYEGLKANTLTYDEARGIFNKLTDRAACSLVVKNFFNVLVDNRRIGLISDIADSFQKELDRENGVVRGTVTSAQNLTSEKKKRA